MKILPALSLLVLFYLSGAPGCAAADQMSLTLDPAGGEMVKFAGAEITKAAGGQAGFIVIAASPAEESRVVSAYGIAPRANSDPQSYAIRNATKNGATVKIVLGVDPAGAMYGGLDLAEALSTGQYQTLADSDHKPGIAQRGIKFNIPLDLRTPSYSDLSDAAQGNIPEMWSIDFWRTFLDDMARDRFNVLSLWNLHPFPSIVKVPEFPDVALNDVWRTTLRLDPQHGERGTNYITADMLKSTEIVKTITIDEKIKFWQDVMQLAHDRGIDVYWFTWNTFVYGAEGKDGITNAHDAPQNIAYLRDSVRALVKTYPLLAGIGLTAGENMSGGDKEKWLAQTYEEGIRDGLKDNPQRKFRLIHRCHQTTVKEIQQEFRELPCVFDLSFKYSVAHMYSEPNPPFIKDLLPQLSPSLRSWLEVRNDDVYSFRWADPEYARAYIKAIPGPDTIAGFFMGPDGYTWGREFLEKNPDSPRQTVMQKQWLSFAIWGRLAYDSDLPDETFEHLVAARFHGANASQLCSSLTLASSVFPFITRFFWPGGGNDFQWFPEACLHQPAASAFYTVKQFMAGKTFPASGVLNIRDWRTSVLAQAIPAGTTPLEIANSLEQNASTAAKALPELRKATITGNKGKEYFATVDDIEAMSDLGLYYAEKIRGACDLALFDKTGNTDQQVSSVNHLETALKHWQDYAAIYTQDNVQPVLYNRVGVVNIPKLTEKVAADVKIAHDWKVNELSQVPIKP